MRILALLLLVLVSGCAGEVQRVCPSGQESVYLEVAAEYWRAQEYSIDVVHTECTVRTKVSDEPPPGFNWPEGIWARHKLYDGFLPNHEFQSDLRFKREDWERISEDERVYIAIHELGHIWYRDHYDWFPMQIEVPENVSFWVETNVYSKLSTWGIPGNSR